MSPIKKLFLPFCCSIAIIVLITCKKSVSESGDADIDEPDQDSVSWVIMSNPADPMFASVKTDSSEIEYYGSRDEKGYPSSLKMFVVKRAWDTIRYCVDGKNRPLVIRHSNGVVFQYTWKSDTKADFTATSPDGTISITAQLDIQKRSRELATPALIVDKRVMSENITINMKQCSKDVKNDVGLVQVELRTVVGSQDVSYITARFDGNSYVAALPQTVPNDLLPSPELCDKIQRVLEVVCNASGQTGAIVMEMGCNALTAALVGSGVGATVAAAFHEACTAAVIGFDMYCNMLQASAVPNAPSAIEEICAATFKKRVFDKGVFLQPVAYYYGQTIRGNVLSTIGGSQQIDLALELPCDECTGFDFPGWWNMLDPLLQSALNETIGSSGNQVPEGKELSKLLNITELNIRKRPIKGSLTLPACFHQLKTIWCDSTELTKIDVSEINSLETLACSFSKLTDLKVSKQKIINLYCTNNKLTSLDISNAPNLSQLDCSNNNLAQLNFVGTPEISFISCWGNSITSLNVNNYNKLVRLQCYQNKLAALNVSGCSNLFYISCEHNLLTNLDVSGLNNLGSLSCHVNQLTSLNLSGLSALQLLWCDNNKLTSINASGCTVMKDFRCPDNLLGYAPLLQLMKDLPATSALDWGDCGNNAVSVDNGPDSNDPGKDSDCSKLHAFYNSKFH